ncbi:hypothetical protein C8F01DRAFT_689325 [Mycena amicta]|nr:hypothetical protein C8F01DRAFT_689325 [Mycena amicta]
MNIRDPQPSDVIVKYSTRNSDKQRVFAEFDPAHWTSIVHPGAEVRLEERKPPAAPVQRYDMFKTGPIYLVFGQSDGSLTTWTPFQEGDPFRTPPIDRPSSYAEAVERTVNAVNDVQLKLGIDAAKSMKSAMAQVLTPGKTLSFYFFPSGGRGDLNEWCKIPTSAETNDKQWQEVVPAPGHSDIMGVVAS